MKGTDIFASLNTKIICKLLIKYEMTIKGKITKSIIKTQKLKWTTEKRTNFKKMQDDDKFAG